MFILWVSYRAFIWHPCCLFIRTKKPIGHCSQEVRNCPVQLLFWVFPCFDELWYPVTILSLYCGVRPFTIYFLPSKLLSVPFCFSLCQTASSHPYIDNFLNVTLLQLSDYLAHSLYSVNIYWINEWWMINILNESINKKCFLANHMKESTVLWSKYCFLLANESTVLWRKYYFLLAENKILPTSMLRKKL